MNKDEILNHSKEQLLMLVSQLKFDNICELHDKINSYFDFLKALNKLSIFVPDETITPIPQSDQHEEPEARILCRQ